MKREKAEKKIRKYLHDLHVTLWSDFDLHRPDGFERAVEWFTDQVVRAGLVSDKEPQEAVKIIPDSPIAKEAHKLRANLNPLGIEDSPVESVPDLPVPFDSGFVTYKDAQTCTCSCFDSVELAGVGHMIVDPDCPIHGPHAFPWRKSR
jgi:hypothetical protein